MAPETRRAHFLSLTLTSWSPLQSQGLLLENSTAGQVAFHTTNLSGPRSRLITSASPFASSPGHPLTASEPEIRRSTVAETQHATERFPRCAYLLRHGTPHPESQSDEGCARHSADPQSDSRTHASVATIPDARAQCGVGDETALQSCAAASASGTLGPSSWSELSSSFRDTSSTCATPTSSALTYKATAKAQDQYHTEATTCTVATTMAHFHSASTSSSKGGSRTEQALVPTRKGADRISSERIMGESLSNPISQSLHHAQGSTDYEDVDEDEQDMSNDPNLPAGNQVQGEGQPKKKKTRRAGAAITRVRRMQREVRKLEEDSEEANAQRQLPGRVRFRVSYI